VFGVGDVRAESSSSSFSLKRAVSWSECPSTVSFTALWEIPVFIFLPVFCLVSLSLVKASCFLREASPPRLPLNAASTLSKPPLLRTTPVFNVR